MYVCVCVCESVSVYVLAIDGMHTVKYMHV